jgi:hypothetical protein
MRLLKQFLLVLLAVLVLASTAVYLTPLDAYVPEVEQGLSEQLHEKIGVRHLRLAILPLPHIELLDVSMGGQDGIAVRSVDVQLDLPGLLMGRLAVRRVVVKDGVVHFAQVRKMVALFGDTSVAMQNMTVSEVQFSGMSLIAPEMTLRQLEGRVEFTPAGQLKQAWFAMDEHKATVTLLPQTDRQLALVVQAHNWTPPQLTQIPLDDLLLVGLVGKQDVVVQRFSVASRGIRVAGSGKVDFSDGWRVEAMLNQMDVPLEQLMALQGRPVELTGVLSMKGVLTCHATSLNALEDNFRFAGDMLVRQAKARIVAGSQHPLVLDEIRAHVALQPDHLELSKINAKLYGGSLAGTANIDRKDAVLNVDIAASSIAMQHLVEALSNEVSFSGSMEGAAKLSMRLGDFERFPENFQLTGNFHLRDGILGKVDLPQALGNSSKVASEGGNTRFDDLTGLLNVDAAGYHFRKIKISSGSLSAVGNMDVSPSSQLSGALDADIKGTGGLASMPLVISGTVEQPLVRPSKSAMAGAAVGTAILGPGLGTAVGIKVGGFLNKLFGKDKDKADSKDAASAQPAKK